MNQVNFKDHLKRQMRFIRNSCDSYDAGFSDEAVRIATAIRVLIHKTNQSIPILEYLGVRSTIKLSSSLPKYDFSREMPSLFDGVTEFTFEETGIYPNLTTSFPQKLGVESWWEEVVLISGPNSIHTRKSIILAAANKDGGAHVDQNLNSEFEELLEGLFTFTRAGENPVELDNNHFTALRVFANELLNSEEIQELCT